MSGLLRRTLITALPPLAGALVPYAVRAQAPYPESPITLVAPFSAGGTADRAARLLAERAPRHLPNPAAEIRVENRAGASGALGTQSVARVAPDGNTLLLARVASSAILPALDNRTPYAWDEFTMLGLLDQSPFTLCVRAEAPWPALSTLVAALREQPGKLSFATTGPATLLDLGMRQLFETAGLPFDAAIAVPFRGAGEAVTAFLEGRVELLGSNLSDALPAIRAGKARALVVGSLERLPILPGVPTAGEAEVPGLVQIAGWDALFGPAGLPAPVVAAWTAALAALRSDSAWLKATQMAGAVPMLLGPEATRAFIGAQVGFYRELGRRLGLI
jgi:tripartite-type tricarboxylate transporter receptor subunit TctC